MIYPAIGKLMDMVDSRYTLVVATAKRARLLAEGAPHLVECDSDKVVTIAVNEFAEQKVIYTRSKSLSMV